MGCVPFNPLVYLHMAFRKANRLRQHFKRYTSPTAFGNGSFQILRAKDVGRNIINVKNYLYSTPLDFQRYNNFLKCHYSQNELMTSWGQCNLSFCFVIICVHTPLQINFLQQANRKIKQNCRAYSPTTSYLIKYVYVYKMLIICST